MNAVRRAIDGKNGSYFRVLIVSNMDILTASLSAQRTSLQLLQYQLCQRLETSSISDYLDYLLSILQHKQILFIQEAVGYLDLPLQGPGPVGRRTPRPFRPPLMAVTN